MEFTKYLENITQHGRTELFATEPVPGGRCHSLDTPTCIYIFWPLLSGTISKQEFQRNMSGHRNINIVLHNTKFQPHILLTRIEHLPAVNLGRLSFYLRYIQ